MGNSVQTDKGDFVEVAISYRDHTIIPDAMRRGDGKFDARYTVLQLDIRADVPGPFDSGKAAEKAAIDAGKAAVDAVVSGPYTGTT